MGDLIPKPPFPVGLQLGADGRKASDLAYIDNFLPFEPAYYATTENEHSSLTFQLMAKNGKSNVHIVLDNY